MPHSVPIKVFKIAESKFNPEVTREWLNHIGATNYDIPDGVQDGDLIVGHAAKRCYISFEPGLNPNVNRVRKDWHEYMENILRSGHGSVIEHYTATFAIEGITRVCTSELNRHRAGVAISEGSMRYIRLDDIPFWMPDSIQSDSNEFSHIPDAKRKKELTRDIITEAFGLMEEKYKQLCEIWDIENIPDFTTKKKLTSLFRRIVGMGVSTGGVWTFNGRALRHIIAIRCSEHAEEEICQVFTQVGKIMVESSLMFKDFEHVNGYWIPKYKKV